MGKSFWTTNIHQEGDFNLMIWKVSNSPKKGFGVNLTVLSVISWARQGCGSGCEISYSAIDPSGDTFMEQHIFIFKLNRLRKTLC